MNDIQKKQALEKYLNQQKMTKEEIIAVSQLLRTGV